MKFYALLPTILHILAWPVTALVLRFRTQFTVTGREHLDELQGPILIAANHVSDLDPVLTRYVLGWSSQFTPLFWVGRYRKDYDSLPKHERFDGWRAFLYSDLFFRVWGSYPAIKGTGQYDHSLKHHTRLLKDGQSVCIFPRGGKEKYVGKDAPVHGGIAFLASHAGVPVVPMYISGTLGLNPKKLFFKKPTIAVTIGAPIVIPPLPRDSAPDEYYKDKASLIMKTVDALKPHEDTAK